MPRLGGRRAERYLPRGEDTNECPNMRHMRNKVEYLGAVNCERNYLTGGGVGQLRTRVQAFLETLA